MARIPASIRTAYVSVFEWPNCDGGMNPITSAATDEMAPSTHSRPRAGAR
jgi:hypothetical protein